MSDPLWHVEVESWRGAFSEKPFFLYHVRSETDLIAKVFTTEDDATLIAVAPELLAAAKAALFLMETSEASTTLENDTYADLELAVSKAERG